MGGYHNFYGGANYGLDPNYGEDFLKFNYRASASGISLATDARTANQLQATSEKLNTGAKALEVQAVSPEIMDTIPKEHFKELERLKQLTGVEFTFHGPLVEPTGVSKQGWDETHRLQSENHMWSAVERAQKLDSKGNLVMTFHSSASLPEPETTVLDENGNPKTTSIYLVDERTGQFAPANLEKHYFPGEEKKTIFEDIKRRSEEEWDRNLQHISFNAHAGSQEIKRIINEPIVFQKGDKKEEIQKNELLDLYKKYGTDEYKEKLLLLPDDLTRSYVKDKINNITHAHLYLRDAYTSLKTLYDNAYDSAQRNSISVDPDKKKQGELDLNKLNKFAEEMRPKLKDFEDPTKINELSNEIVEGVNILRSIDKPNKFTPLRDFAIDKGSTTFANVAFKAYEKFKDNAPVLSIENPPAGQGLSRAEDLRDLVEASRKKLILKLENEQGMSESSAKEQAEKLIGVTWDVGHINMIKKWGYDDKALAKQTETISKYVKNIHLSDNFGMEHTELPMGMGNVPIKKHMEILNAYNNKIKKVIETGGWYQYFKTTPFPETLSAFGSPIYSMEMGPSWNQAYGRTNAGYFAGYGMNPDIHHSYFGAGFSNLPVELGGQMPGKSSRFSGAPMD